MPFRPFVPTATFEAPGTPAAAPAHRIIHGDNLEALKSLLPEFAGRVKCLYIDPPYNTGNEGYDSTYKRRLGAAWATAAGAQYRYYMVFDKLDVPGAQRLGTFGGLLAEL